MLSFAPVFLSQSLTLTVTKIAASRLLYVLYVCTAAALYTHTHTHILSNRLLSASGDQCEIFCSFSDVANLFLCRGFWVIRDNKAG